MSERFSTLSPQARTYWHTFHPAQALSMQMNKTKIDIAEKKSEDISVSPHVSTGNSLDYVKATPLEDSSLTSPLPGNQSVPGVDFLNHPHLTAVVFKSIGSNYRLFLCMPLSVYNLHSWNNQVEGAVGKYHHHKQTNLHLPHSNVQKKHTNKKRLTWNRFLDQIFFILFKSAKATFLTCGTRRNSRQQQNPHRPKK